MVCGMPRLSTSLAGIELRNPIIAGSGTCGYVDDLADAVDLRAFGAITTKSITVEERTGNPTWRILDMPWGMLNAIGLANVGLDRFIAEKLPSAATIDTPVFGSIAGGSIDDYLRVAAAFDESELLPAVELNVSCPNTDDGLVFGENINGLRSLLQEVRPALTRTKMFVKLSPNVGNIVELAQQAIECGADGLTLVNTVQGMSIDVDSRKSRLSVGTGGYSGPAIHPIAVRIVYDIYHNVACDAGVPIIGLGGVTSWRDAAELVLAGATAVGVGTALFANPRAPLRIARRLERWVARQGCDNLRELIGQAALP